MKATSTTMFLIGVFRGVPRVIVALALVARRLPEARGKLFRMMRITMPVIGCSILTLVRRGEGEIW
jgi:hypothetical protein